MVLWRREEDALLTHAIRLFTAAGAVLISLTGVAVADDSAQAIFKKMADFLVQQTDYSAGYDATLDIVTADLMKVGFASSGVFNVKRPRALRVTRTGGIADVELVYDGKNISVYGKNRNMFAKIPIEGKIDDAIDELRVGFGLELPAADLLSSDPYKVMMANVVSSVDLGTGVIRGAVCDHIAFRTEEVDWQLWVAQGDKPLPCRFTITSKLTVHSPSYSIEFHDWKTGADVAADDFVLKPAADAKEVDFANMGSIDEVPAPSAEGEGK